MTTKTKKTQVGKCCEQLDTALDALSSRQRDGMFILPLYNMESGEQIGEGIQLAIGKHQWRILYCPWCGENLKE